MGMLVSELIKLASGLDAIGQYDLSDRVDRIVIAARERKGVFFYEQSPDKKKDVVDFMVTTRQNHPSVYDEQLMDLVLKNLGVSISKDEMISSLKSINPELAVRQPDSTDLPKEKQTEVKNDVWNVWWKSGVPLPAEKIIPLIFEKHNAIISPRDVKKIINNKAESMDARYKGRSVMEYCWEQMWEGKNSEEISMDLDEMISAQKVTQLSRLYEKLNPKEQAERVHAREMLIAKPQSSTVDQGILDMIKQMDASGMSSEEIGMELGINPNVISEHTIGARGGDRKAPIRTRSTLNLRAVENERANQQFPGQTEGIIGANPDTASRMVNRLQRLIDESKAPKPEQNRPMPTLAPAGAFAEGKTMNNRWAQVGQIAPLGGTPPASNAPATTENSGNDLMGLAQKKRNLDALRKQEQLLKNQLEQIQRMIRELERDVILSQQGQGTPQQTPPA